MPLFKKGGANFSDSRRSDGERKPTGSRVAGVGALSPAHARASRPQQPYVHDQPHTNVPAPGTPHQQAYEVKQQPPPSPPPKFVFYCQLAHGSPTGKVEGFTNVKELYQKIGDVFRINANEILFCTLNTYRIDMERLLGGQIGLDDFIFAHIKGQRKLVTVLKTCASLGLTITDNGAGCSFIKRIKDGSIVDGVAQICTGDHIEAVNNETVVGARHYDVARMLREFPLGHEITFQLVEPMRGFEGIGPRTSSRGANTAVSPESSAVCNAVGTGKTTLRLRSKGPPVVETQEAPAWEVKAAQKIDDLLESFLGIRDPDLAETLVSKGKAVSNPSDFAMAVEEEFGEFQFPEYFIFDIWGAVTDAKNGRS